MEKEQCLICESDKYQIIGPLRYDYLKQFNTHFHLVKCLICNFHYLSPLLKDNDLIEIYSETYHFHKNSRLVGLYELYSGFSVKRDARLIKRYKSGGNLLDIGGGSGRFLNYFDSSWVRYYVDPSPSAIDTLGKEIKIFNKYLEECQFEDNFFDVVVLRNVLEHTSNPYPLLNEIHRILKPNGILFIRTPNINSLDFKLFREYWYVVQSPGHIAFYSLDSIKKLLKCVSLNIVHQRTTAYSAPLSFFRSYNFKRLNNSTRPQSLILPLSLAISLAYSLISLIFGYGKGGEMKLICTKANNLFIAI